MNPEYDYLFKARGLGVAVVGLGSLLAQGWSCSPGMGVSAALLVISRETPDDVVCGRPARDSSASLSMHLSTQWRQQLVYRAVRLMVCLLGSP